jgi:hypothetical protein
MNPKFKQWLEQQPYFLTRNRNNGLYMVIECEHIIPYHFSWWTISNFMIKS